MQDIANTVVLNQPYSKIEIKRGIYAKYIKRPMDFILALLALIVLSPIMLIIALIVRLRLGGPVIFKHPRPGLDEQIFTLYKFRTMTDQKDGYGNPLPDTERLEGIGRILRATSLDELPELWNILKGEMSIVGPRPLLIEYLPLYSELQKRRHCVKPGLSGLAQINGRNDITWEKKFEFDIQYVENITFLGDVKIIFKTIWKAFVKQEGINSKNSVTAESFIGNPQEKAEEAIENINIDVMFANKNMKL